MTDPGIPRGGHESRGYAPTYCLTNFVAKTALKRKNLDRRHPLLDPPLLICFWLFHKTIAGQRTSHFLSDAFSAGGMQHPPDVHYYKLFVMDVEDVYQIKKTYTTYIKIDLFVMNSIFAKHGFNVCSFV